MIGPRRSTPLTAVAAVQPEPAGCEKCRESERIIADLAERNRALLAALQRESHHIDKRAGHDGSRYLKRKED